MKLVYISGPYTSDSIRGTVNNIRRAEASALSVLESGHAALCPHLNTGLFDGSITYDTFMAGDLLMVERCDCLLMVDGWEHSKGSKIEYDCALALGLPVFHSVQSLVEYYPHG